MMTRLFQTAVVRAGAARVRMRMARKAAVVLIMRFIGTAGGYVW